MFVRVNVLVVCLLLPAAYAGELKLEEAIELALDRNAAVVNAKLEVEKAGDRLAAYRTRLRPNTSFYALAAQQLRPVDFTIERGQLGNFASTGPIPSNDVKLSTPLEPTGLLVGKVAQPLSGIYKVRLTLASLNIGKRLAEEDVRAQRQDLVWNVKRLYYDIQQTESSLEVAHQMAKLYRETERLTAGYVVQQVALEADHLEAQTQFARAEQEELTLSDRLASSKEQLNQLLGRDVTTEFTVSPIQEAGGLPIELVEARRQALEQRPEVRQSQLKIQQAQQDLKIKRSEYIPDVTAEFNSMTLVNFSSFLPGQTASVGVSVTWEPFDWGRKKHEAAEKRRTVEQAKNTELDARNKVLVDVDEKFRKLQQIRAQFRVARLNQKTAVERLRITNRKYELQAALFRNVLESQSTLQKANDDYIQTLAKLWTAKAEFEHAIGEDR